MGDSNKSIDSLTQQAEVYLLNKNYKKLIQVSQKIISADPNNATGYTYKGVAHYHMGQFYEALNCYECALAINSNLDNVLMNMADIHRQQKKYNIALLKIQKAIELNPAVSDYFYVYAAICHDTSDFRTAEKYAQKALELNPNNSLALNLLVIVQRRDLESSIEGFKKSLEVDTTNMHTYNYLGVLYIKAGHYKEAENCFKTALDLEPGNSIFIKNHLAALAYESWMFRFIRWPIDFIYRLRISAVTDKGLHSPFTILFIPLLLLLLIILEIVMQAIFSTPLMICQILAYRKTTCGISYRDFLKHIILDDLYKIFKIDPEQLRRDPFFIPFIIIIGLFAVSLIFVFLKLEEYSIYLFTIAILVLVITLLTYVFISIAGLIKVSKGKRKIDKFLSQQ